MSEELIPEGERLRKAIKWISEMVKEYPEKPRIEIIQEAEIRFDLSPKDCEFLQKKFA
jgi:hypothetical protein